MMDPPVWNVIETPPFHILLKHALAVKKVMEHLLKLFAHRAAHNEIQAQTALEAIGIHEREADIIKRDLHRILNDNVFLPVNRRDLLEVILLQDAIANKIKDISGLFFFRNMTIIPPWQDTWEDFIRTLEVSVCLVVQLNEDLVRVLEAGFNSRMQKHLSGTVSQLDTCENEHDRLLTHMRHELYKYEKQMPDIDIWFYYQLLERMGNVTDLARRLGFQLLTLVTR